MPASANPWGVCEWRIEVRDQSSERRLERETGIEPATNSLDGCDSTTELLPPTPARSCAAPPVPNSTTVRVPTLPIQTPPATIEPRRPPTVLNRPLASIREAVGHVTRLLPINSAAAPLGNRAPESSPVHSHSQREALGG